MVVPELKMKCMYVNIYVHDHVKCLFCAIVQLFALMKTQGQIETETTQELFR